MTNQFGSGLSLILMRHAKSDWSNTSLADHDRPLNDRGRRDAPRMAQWLAEIDQIPDRILCSSAVRTRQTVTGLTDLWNACPAIHYSHELYHAQPQEIIDNIRLEGGDARRLLIVAHNPGLTRLASDLSGLFVEMPTAAIAIFSVGIDGANGTELVEFMRPKALQ